MRFGRKSFVREISYVNFKSIIVKYPKVKKAFYQFKTHTHSQLDSIPLDYIMRIPRYLREKNPEKDYHNMQRLENVVKNIVMKMLAQIKADKNRPSLKETIMEYVKKREAKDERVRERIKDQVLQQHEALSFK